MTNKLIPAPDFRIAGRFDGLSDAELAEINDQLDDLGPDDEGGGPYRTIKVPVSGDTAFKVQADDDGNVDYVREFSAVIVFTHLFNGYWSGAYGASEDKIPACSSLDGKSGLNRTTGEVTSCADCPLNQFGSAPNGGRGKACKNMLRIYLLMSGDPNFYLLTVPPTSLTTVKRKLKSISNSGAFYTSVLLRFRLSKTLKNGNEYSVINIEKAGALPPDVAATIVQMRHKIKDEYRNFSTPEPPAYATGQPPVVEYEEVGGEDDLPF